MSGGAFENFRRAIIADLQADAGLMALVTGIYDQPPRSAALPYLTLGPMAAQDWSSKSHEGYRFRLTINVFSDKRSDMDMLVMADSVKAHLLAGGLSPVGFHIAHVNLDGFNSLTDPDGVRHGLLRFSILMHAL